MTANAIDLYARSAHRRGSRLLAARITLSGVALITACSSSDVGEDASASASPDLSATSSSVAAPTIGSEPTGVADAALNYVRPPDVGDLNPISNSELKLQHDVQQRLVQNCMARSGFDYALAPLFADTSEYPPLILSRIPTEGYLQAVGVPDETEQSGDEALAGYDGAVAVCFDDAFVTMYGTPRASTMSEGEEYSQPSTTHEEFLALLSADDPTARVNADERFVVLQEDWSACMSANGISASSFDELIGQFMVRPPDQPPSQTEINAATADYHCRNEVDLYARFAAIQQDHVDQWADENQAALAELTTRAQQESARIVELAAELGVG